MSMPARPSLDPGRVYRTRDLARWGANPPRLAKRLVEEGSLVPLARGLFAAPKTSRFGVAPPTDDELMRGFLAGDEFVFTGPPRWNALGLGSTAAFASTLIYNRKRSGTFVLAGRRFLLRRVAFPENPPAEWFVVDLLENAETAGTSRDRVRIALAKALALRRFDVDRLSEMSMRYGTKPTRDIVNAAIRQARA